MKTTLHKKGMSLIEVMVAGAILAIILVLIIGGFEQIKKRQRYESIKQASMWQVYHLVERIKYDLDPQPYIQAYTMSEALEHFKKYGSVSDGWSHKKSSCNPSSDLTCKGRIGHAIYPLKDFPGFVLVIGISHPEVFLQTFDSSGKGTDVIVYKQYILGSE